MQPESERIDGDSLVACSLNDEQFGERRALARRTLLTKITAARRIRHGLILTFAGDESVRADLETFVSLERQCCQFLQFTISPQTPASNSPLELRIAGPAEAAATIEIFARAVGLDVTAPDGSETTGPASTRPRR